METANDKIDDLSAEVSSLTIDATPEEFASKLDKLKFFEERIKAIRKALEAAIFDHCKATGDRIKIGPIEYYVGPDKVTKLRKEKAGELLELCINLAGGNHQEAALTYLASSPFKYGEFKKQAGDDAFNQFFEVTYEDKLEKTGEKKLKQINTDFIK